MPWICITRNIGVSFLFPYFAWPLVCGTPQNRCRTNDLNSVENKSHFTSLPSFFEFFFLYFSSFLLLHLWALFIIQYACNAISLLCKLIFYFQFNFTHGHNECWMDCMKMAIENNLYSSALWVFSFWISILVCGKFFFFYFIFLLFSCVYMLSSFFTTLYYMWCEYVANAKESCVDTFKQTNCINTLYMRIRDWQKAKEKKKKLNSCVSNTQQAPNHIHSTNPWDFWQLERIRNEFRLRQHNQDTTRGHCRFCNSLQRIHFKLPIFDYFQFIFWNISHFIILTISNSLLENYDFYSNWMEVAIKCNSLILHAPATIWVAHT